MTIRSMLLAGSVLPFAFGSALALEPARAVPGSFVLAQAEACPEGQECPPAEAGQGEGGGEGAAPANRRQRALERAQRRQQQLQQQQGQGEAGGGQAEEAPAEQAEQPVEQPQEAPAEQAEQPVEEPQQGAPAEQPQEEAAQPEAGGGQPPATREERRQRARERAERRRQQEQQQGGAGGGEQPEPLPAETAEPEQGEAGEQPEVAEEPAREGGEAGESTVEQQLEAQGDEEEAERVRQLRAKLRRQRQQAEEAARQEGGEAGEVEPGEEEAAEGEAGEAGEEQAGRPRDQDDGGEAGGRERDRGRVVERRGDRIIIDLGGGQIVVRPVVPDEGERLLHGAQDVEVEHLRGGRTRTTVFRANGSKIITLRNRYGDIIRRIRVTANGRQIVLIDNRFDDRDQPPVIFEPLPPPLIGIPEDQYIVDLGQASGQDIRGALLAPPVQQVERPYTLEEVTQNESIRAYVPRIDLDTITFDFGSSTIGSNQMDALFELGLAMEEVVAENPDEVYLIEGHTDAVGSDFDNLILSDRRAETVAVALAQNFDIPPENLITEGYGEQYLKVETLEAERANRRVSVRRITELLQAENAQ